MKQTLFTLLTPLIILALIASCFGLGINMFSFTSTHSEHTQISHDCGHGMTANSDSPQATDCLAHQSTALLSITRLPHTTLFFTLLFFSVLACTFQKNRRIYSQGKAYLQRWRQACSAHIALKRCFARGILHTKVFA